MKTKLNSDHYCRFFLNKKSRLIWQASSFINSETPFKRLVAFKAIAMSLTDIFVILSRGYAGTLWLVYDEMCYSYGGSVLQLESANMVSLQ